MITLTLPYPVSANRYWRSFIPRGASRPVTTLSAAAIAYKKEAGKLAQLAGIREPIPGRVRVTMRLYPARPQDWGRRARKDPDNWDDTVQCLDLDNARKVVYDALKGIAYGDDKMIRQDAAERCEPDEYGARVELTIEPIVRASSAPALFGEECAA